MWRVLSPVTGHCFVQKWNCSTVIRQCIITNAKSYLLCELLFVPLFEALCVGVCGSVCRRLCLSLTLMLWWLCLIQILTDPTPLLKLLDSNKESDISARLLKQSGKRPFEAPLVPTGNKILMMNYVRVGPAYTVCQYRPKSPLRYLRGKNREASCSSDAAINTFSNANDLPITLIFHFSTILLLLYSPRRS